MLLTAVIIEFLLAVVVAYLAWQFFSLRSEYYLHILWLHGLDKWVDEEGDDDGGDTVVDSAEAASTATSTDAPIPQAYRAEDDDPDSEDPDIKKQRESQRGFFS